MASSPSPVTFQYSGQYSGHSGQIATVRATSAVVGKPTTGILSNIRRLNDGTESLWLQAVATGSDIQREREKSVWKGVGDLMICYHFTELFQIPWIR